MSVSLLDSEINKWFQQNYLRRNKFLLNLNDSNKYLPTCLQVLILSGYANTESHKKEHFSHLIIDIKGLSTAFRFKITSVTKKICIYHSLRNWHQEKFNSWKLNRENPQENAVTRILLLDNNPQWKIQKRPLKHWPNNFHASLCSLLHLPQRTHTTTLSVLYSICQ